MKKFLALAIIAPLLGACNFQTFQATFTSDVTSFEAQVTAVIAKIKANVPVALADLQTVVNITCGQLLPLAQSGAAAVQTGIANPGPKTTAAVAATQQALSTASTSCTQATSATGNALVNDILAIWNGVTKAKAGVAAAQNAAGT